MNRIERKLTCLCIQTKRLERNFQALLTLLAAPPPTISIDRFKQRQRDRILRFPNRPELVQRGGA